MKNDKKYVTLNNGVDFRSIAKIMSKHNYKMNHATARNQLMIALNNLLEKTAEKVGTKISKDTLVNLLKDQGVHDSLTDVLYTAYRDYLIQNRKAK